MAAMVFTCKLLATNHLRDIKFHEQTNPSQEICVQATEFFLNLEHYSEINANYEASFPLLNALLKGDDESKTEVATLAPTITAAVVMDTLALSGSVLLEFVVHPLVSHHNRHYSVLVLDGPFRTIRLFDLGDEKEIDWMVEEYIKCITGDPSGIRFKGRTRAGREAIILDHESRSGYNNPVIELGIALYNKILGPVLAALNSSEQKVSLPLSSCC